MSSDPLCQLHHSLQPAIQALEKRDLNLALDLFLGLGPWHCFPWNKEKPTVPSSVIVASLDNLFSCYFDAHLFSESHSEFKLLSQKLLQRIESDDLWVFSHPQLIVNLQNFDKKSALLNHLLNQSEEETTVSLHLNALDNKRLEWLKENLILAQRHDFRIPLHQGLRPNPTLSSSTLIFYDIGQLNRFTKIGPENCLTLCSSALAACYLLTWQDSNYGSIIFGSQDHVKAQKTLTSYFQHNSKNFEYLENLRPAKVAQEFLLQLLQIESNGNNFFQFEHYRLIQFLLKSLDNFHRHNLFNRYGSKSRLALLERFRLYDWHEGLQRRDILLKNDPLIAQTKLLEKTLPKKMSLKVKKNLPRIVHLCSQLYDQSHAPSKIIQRLLSLADRMRYDVAIIVSESLIQRDGDYPLSLRSAQPSLERGAQTIHFLEREKIAYSIEKPFPGDCLEAIADRLATKLASLDIDILVFHGPEPLHHAIASALKGPIKVLFEHGSLPQTSGFDYVISSLEDTVSCHEHKLAELNSKLKILPFFADSRYQWNTHFQTKADFGLDDNVMIATTISNHLETRLTSQFCYAISSILMQCPNLYYLPIGAISNPQHLIMRFDPDVRSRIRFIGSSPHPSQLTRCMDIYFNEFPFGSCYGILDAMASGCSVVSMYDPKGPPQARYGRDFLGSDLVITSLDVEDYIHRACELVQNPLALFKSSQRSFQGYEWRSNIWAYVHRFEAILEEILPKGLS
jgi:glycosyltransferase involved in cell wall biosynthesis